jgi:hypothetical protein
MAKGFKTRVSESRAIITADSSYGISGERSSFKFRPRIEACNMIGVKGEPKQTEGLKRRRSRKNEHKENQRRCCIRQDKGREAACEDQKND